MNIHQILLVILTFCVVYLFCIWVTKTILGAIHRKGSTTSHIFWLSMSVAVWTMELIKVLQEA